LGKFLVKMPNKLLLDKIAIMWYNGNFGLRASARPGEACHYGSCPGVYAMNSSIANFPNAQQQQNNAQARMWPGG